MPLDESLYQQHHRVLARIDQLGKGAASRLPPEAVAQIKALEAQLATAQGEADDLRAQLAHELNGELSRDELMEALTTTKTDLEASQQALRASEAARAETTCRPVPPCGIHGTWFDMNSKHSHACAARITQGRPEAADVNLGYPF